MLYEAMISRPTNKNNSVSFYTYVALLLLFILPIDLSAQNPTSGQTIKGVVRDKDAKFTLINVSIQLYSDTGLVASTVTDMDGEYKFENVSVGRYRITSRFVGYADRKVSLFVSSGKEVVMDVEMEERVVELDAVKISVSEKGESVNEMSTGSSRSFDAEETNRYAGSRQDPARMASNFAGVQGADDSRNDIVIRGNSPMGVLWRLNGVNLPNPNHFAIPGTTGGGVSVINSKTLSTSDFHTGAFPAEFGNTISGVFDVRLRKGNRDKHEFSSQIGLLGLEALAEGPISREKKSSYLVNYRYSTLGIFNSLGVDIGTNAVPNYQDATFNLNFPGKDHASYSVFGVFGQSDIDIVISDQKDTSEIDLFAENDRDQFFGTAMGVLGMTYSNSFGEKAYLNSTFSGSFQIQDSYHQGIDRHVNEQGEFEVDSIFDIQRYNYKEYKVSNATFYTRKKNKKNVIKGGMVSDVYFFNYKDSLNKVNEGGWDLRIDYSTAAALLQPFIQWKHKFSDDLVLNAGWHIQYFSLSNSLSLLEPRVGLKWKFSDKQSVNIGVGAHSQIHPTYNYFYQFSRAGEPEDLYNLDMGFSKSNHIVFGYDNHLSQYLRLKFETYYQQLYNIPVERMPSSYSMVNQGNSFRRIFPNELSNDGTGMNYGLELTLEKFFSKNYFFMLTGSLYESKYRGSDGVLRNTDFNGNFALNLLAGTDIKITEKTHLELGTKITWAGGKRYGEVDSLQSDIVLDVVFKDEGYNELQFQDYFRIDFKVSYKIHAKKVTHEIALDLINAFDTENILNFTYAPRPGSDQPPIRINPQLGRLPVFYYKIDF